MLAWWIVDAKKNRIDTVFELIRRNSHADPQTGDRMAAVSSMRRSLYAQIASLHDRASRLSSASTLPNLDVMLFKPIELLNTGWLLYITLAQTFGAYRTCECITTSWGRKNYLDLTQIDMTPSTLIRMHWITGTALSVSAMGLALGYVVVQWCLQSHLSTRDLEEAATGLRRARTFRMLMSPLVVTVRYFLNGCHGLVSNGITMILSLLRVEIKRSNEQRRTTLRWSKHVTRRHNDVEQAETIHIAPELRNEERSGELEDERPMGPNDGPVIVMVNICNSMCAHP